MRHGEAHTQPDTLAINYLQLDDDLAWNAHTAPDLFIFQMNLTSKINQLSSIITLMISKFNRCEQKSILAENNQFIFPGNTFLQLTRNKWTIFRSTVSSSKFITCPQGMIQE